MNKFNTVEEELQRMRELSGIKEILDESGFARINRILWGDVPSVNSVGIITAENPHGQPLSAEENNKRTESLLSTIRSSSFGYIKIKGKDVKNNRIEDSFIVPNMNKSWIIWLGKKYEQEAVIYGERKDKNTFLFEYIEDEKTTKKEEVNLTKLSGDEIYYSYLPKTSKKDGNKVRYERSFVIPFIDVLKRIPTGKGTWEISEHYGFLDVDLEDLPKDNKEINALLEDIKKNEKELLVENLLEKYYLPKRYFINKSIKIIKEILDQSENKIVDIDTENLPKKNEQVLNLLKEISGNKKGLLVNDSLAGDYFIKKDNIDNSFRKLKKLIKENIIHKLTDEQLEEVIKEQEIYSYFLTYDNPFIYPNEEQHYENSKKECLEKFNLIPKKFKKFCFEEYQRNIK